MQRETTARIVSAQHAITGVTQEVFDFASFAVHTRLARTWSQDRAGYAIHRALRFSAHMDLELLLDDLALNLGYRSHRIDGRSIVLEADQVLISGLGIHKPEYCSCTFKIWADTPQRADAARGAILARAGEALMRDPMISIDWTFRGAKGELHCADLEEIADDVLYDEAYPDLQGGVTRFIGRYLDAEETVLVLQGPAGTGKTRLIRGVLGEIARRKRDTARVLFTGDKAALESDEIFVRFLTSACDAFVVEDADHLLQPRAEGNDNLHRFLTIADGIVSAQGRKIIFSTNLPNVGDLDDALVRPGRCFARVSTRRLLASEAKALLSVLSAGAEHDGKGAFATLVTGETKNHSLAEVFKALNERKHTAMALCRLVNRLESGTDSWS